MSARVAITGSSGYLGSKLVEQALENGCSVFGIDIQPAIVQEPSLTSICADVSDESIAGHLVDFNPDVVIHAAFVFQPLRNQRLMRSRNIGGFETIAQAVSQVRPDKFHVVSSATVYGAHANTGASLKENSPFRPTRFQYAADKQAIEERLERFAVANPKIKVSWSRPSLVGGPNIDNYMSRFLFGMPMMVLPDGNDTPLQFVHENDAVDAIMKIIESGRTGPFNIGPSDASPLSLIAEKSDRRSLSLPYWLCYSVHALAWYCRLPIHESPPSLLEYARHRWVVDSARLTQELGFQFQHSSDQTLDIMIDQLLG